MCVMKNNLITCREDRAIDPVGYLSLLGHKPVKIRNNDHWYLSPLRNEKGASFKVNRRLNLWYDFGIGKGGGLIDFGLLHHHCSIPELLEKLAQNTLSFQQHHAQTGNPLDAFEKRYHKKIGDGFVTGFELRNRYFKGSSPQKISPWLKIPT
jgi:hypothetical protein